MVRRLSQRYSSYLGCILKVLNTLAGNSADETTRGGDGEGGEKAA